MSFITCLLLLLLCWVGLVFDWLIVVVYDCLLRVFAFGSSAAGLFGLRLGCLCL